jgi:hypothetical protein
MSQVATKFLRKQTGQKTVEAENKERFAESFAATYISPEYLEKCQCAKKGEKKC